MMLIKLTRTADGKTIYVNPQTINAIYPDYNSGVTIIQFVDEDGRTRVYSIHISGRNGALILVEE